MTTKKNLLIRGGADFSGMKKAMQDAQNSVNNFKRNVSNSLKGIGATIATLGIGFAVKKSIQSAMEVEASMQQINRLMGESSRAFMNWANTSATAFNMSRSEATKYGAVYGNLLSNFTKDMSETAKYTQELLETSAVVASATGRSMQDTMERIRSGLLGNTEAIEDLGINVNVAMIESTEAFRRFANDKSWQQLDFQTQQQIRYFAILEQASKKYGDEVANNTISRQQQFIAQLKNIQLHLGNAFLPIYNRVLPALTSLASKLAQIMSIIAQFSQALFGKANTGQVNQTEVAEQQSNAVSDLGDSYKKAGKAAKKAQGFLAGFDEVNTVTKKDAGGGSGDSPLDVAGGATGAFDGGTSPIDFETNAPEISEKVQAMAAKIKESFKNLTNFIKENKEIIVSSFAGIAAGFATMLVAFNWGKIVAGAKLAFGAVATIISGISWPIVAIATAIAGLTAAFVYFYRNNGKFRGVVDGILNKIKDAAVWLWEKVLVPLGKFIADSFVNAWEDLKEIGKMFLEKVLKPLGDLFKTIWNEILVPLATFLANKFKPIWDEVIDVFKELHEKVLKPLDKYLANSFMEVVDEVFSSIGGLIKGLETTLVGIVNFITGVFTGDWKKAWEGVKTIFKGVFDSLYSIVRTPLNMIIDAINAVIRGLNRINIDVPSWVGKIPGVPDGISSFGFNISRIPRLARGGIVDGETNMGNYIAGEAGAEMIVPLENTSFVDKLASALGSAVYNAMSASTSGSETGDVILKVGEVELGRVAAKSINKAQRISGNLLLDI